MYKISIANKYKVIILVIIIFFILELATRLYLFGFNAFDYNKMNSMNYIGLSGLIKPSPYPEIIYELKPNLSTYYMMYKFTTNSEGLRDKEYTIQKSQNTFRVVVMGDSFTMPEGMDINDAYHKILENRLNKETSNISYEFINYFFIFLKIS